MTSFGRPMVVKLAEPRAEADVTAGGMQGKHSPWIGALLAAVVAVAGCSGRDGAKATAAAKDMLGQRQYKSAIIDAKNALQSNPKNAEARLYLGQALVQTGDAVAAEVELRKALEAGSPDSKTLPWLAKAVLAQGDSRRVILEFAATVLPDAASSADLRTTVAAAYAQSGQRDNALDAVRSALADWPQHSPATLLQARLLAAQGDMPGATALVDSVLTREPANVAGLVLKADLLRAGPHDDAAALQAYRKAVAAEPQALAAHEAIISMLLGQGQAGPAREQFQRLQAALPRHPETLLYEAQFAYLDKQFERTRELTGQLLKAFPDDARILRLAGANELKLNSLSQAQAYLGRAIKAAPQASDARELLAQTYLRTGQPKRALELLEPVIGAAHPDARSLTLAGQAYLQQGDLTHAETSFAAAAKLDPQSQVARTALAVTQLEKGQVDAGFAGLEALAKTEPGTMADLALISARLRRHDLAGALTAVDALEKKQPDKPVAATLRGTIQVKLDNPDAARASFEKALSIDRLYYPATAGLASLDLAAGRPDGAKRRFDELLAIDPKNERAMLGLAELKIRTQAAKADVTQALAAAIAANPSEPAPRLLLIDYLLHQKDEKAALAAAQDASAALPNSLDLMQRLGAAQLAAGQAQQAVNTYGKLARLVPDRVEVQLRLANAYLALKDLDSARQSLRNALGIDPHSVAAQRGLVEIALLQKRTDEALSIAREMQRAEPNNPAGYVLEADVQSATGQALAAAAALRLALPLSGRSETAIQLHRALVAAGHQEEAGRLLTRWQKDHAKDAILRYYLGDLAMADKDLPSAEAQYRGVLELQPTNALAMNNIAWLMTRLGQSGAVAMAERANNLMPGQPALMDTWASALAQANQFPKAIELQRKAVDQAPEDAGLRLSLAKIYLKAGDPKGARSELERLAKLGDKFAAHQEVAQLLKSM